MNNKPVHGDYIQGSSSDHPGVPVGNDKVPAWLSPNEFVVNQEATRMYGPQIEAMNNHGRAVQAQQGGMTPPVPSEAQYLEVGGLVQWLGSLFGQPEAIPAQQTAVPQVPAPVPPQAPVPVAQMTAPQMTAPQMTAPVPDQAPAVPQNQAPPAPSYDMFSGDNWNTYSNAVASLESQGEEDPYSIYGGANDHYVGKYQLGASAIADASRMMGLETTPTREQVRQNPALQEQMFNAFTKGNHNVLMQNSPEYRSMDPAAQQRVLGYAHNQGAGGAVKFLRTGEAGSDAFGTSGTKYMERIAKAQGGEWTAPNNPAGRYSANQLGIPSQPHGSPAAADQGGVDFSQGYQPVGLPPVPMMDNPQMSIPGSVPQPGATPQFIPQGVSGQPSAVFQDPAFQTMAQRSGMDPKGYWNSLHPEAQAQHLKRVGAGPAVYTNQDQMDVSNRVGANSEFAATPDVYDLANVPSGYAGSPVAPSIPTMDGVPTMPAADGAPNMTVPGQLAVPSMDASAANPNAIPNAYRDYGESRMEADYQSQQELDRITQQLQTTTRDAPAYALLKERQATLLSNLGRNDPTYTGSSIPSPEVLGTDILSNVNEQGAADQKIAEQTQAIQEAASRGDFSAVTAAENALKDAHKQKADAMLAAADMTQIRQDNALEDQARQNAAIQSEVADLDKAIESATTPEGKAALIQARDDRIESATVPAMAPAGQADNPPAMDRETADALKTSPETVAAVETRVADAEAQAEAAGEAGVPTDLTSEAAVAAGDKAATADPSAFSGAMGFVKDLFGDLFDAKELKRMAVLYLGARVTGASHGSSLAFAGKSYLTRVDAKQTAYDTVAASDKYTKESVAVFKQSRDYNDLALKGLPTTKTGLNQSFWDKDGNEVRAEQVQIGDSKIWIGSNGQQLNTFELTETAPADQEAQIQKAMTGLEGILGDLRDERSKDEESGKYSNKIVPSVDARKIAAWAVKHDVPPEKMGDIIQAAYADMENAKGKGYEVTSLMPYIRQNVIRQQTGGNAGVFVVEPATETKPAVYVDAQKLSVLNDSAVKWLTSKGHSGDTSSLSNTFYNSLITDWNAELTQDERDKYNKGAAPGTNGFFTYAQEMLNQELLRSTQ